MELLFNEILRFVKNRRLWAMATLVASRGSSPRKVAARMLVFPDGTTEGTIGGGALEKLVICDCLAALKRRQSFLKEYSLDKRAGLSSCGGKVSIFIEAFEPQKNLLIAGAGHIGLALSFIAKLLNFRVFIVDNRREFAAKKRFPHADRVVCGRYRQVLKKLVDANTYVVIVTHGHRYDQECLEAVINLPSRYIGMIGSAAKIKYVFGLLRKKGVSGSRLRQVHTPVGLDIGAQTAEEIAVSIAAQLVAVSKQ